jgi:hypothetical protein
VQTPSSPQASPPEGLFLAYFAVFLILVIAESLFLWRRGPQHKWRWHARLGLLNVLVLGGIMAAIVVGWGQWIALPVLLAFAAFIGYGVVRKIRVCESCGSTVQPQSLVVAAKYCPRCSSALRPSPLWPGGSAARD